MNPQFTIIREDLLLDPVTIITDGLLIGRLKECELLLNHPAVSRVQAGIKAIDANYYLFNLRPANPPILNGRPIEQNEALASGDVLEIGPFILVAERVAEELVLRVTLRIGVVAAGADLSSPNIETQKLEEALPTEGAPKKKRAPRPAPLPGTKALDIFWDKRIREAGKVVRPSTLTPRSQKRSGKAQFNWTPTSDLKRKWPGSFFIWGFILVAAGAVAGAFLYANAFAPAPVSEPHVRSTLQSTPPIANRANANSCTSCHSLTKTVDQNCASCHVAAGFAPDMIKSHVDAGINCIACHAEHKGADFRPREAAFQTCTDCHNDLNKNTYRGRSVRTPHGGGFGYPVVNAMWEWEGLAAEEWASKQIPVARLPTDGDDAWRSKQFHALHLYRVRVPAGLIGNEKHEMSCSSCHKSFVPIDRETPRQTCARCHNGQIDEKIGRALVPADKPNCISCHTQHAKDSWRWNASLMAGGSGQ
ncbi:MAG: hypothetical protein QOE77_3773 [Blastocatellia bacterium]|jgi:hypothetical protein|nr:hypothetical protein [Blastocatellia bacterium]